MQYQEIVDKIPLISIANKKHKYYQIINLYNPSKNMRDKMEYGVLFYDIFQNNAVKKCSKKVR